MANNNLELQPSQGSASTMPGVNDTALARLLTVKLPSGPAPRGANAPTRLAASIARLPSSGRGKNASQLFLP